MRVAVATALLLTGLAIAPAKAQTFQHYACVDGASFDLAFFPETKAAYLQFEGKNLMLPKRFSLVSQRFAKGGIVLSIKGGGLATIRRAGRTSSCRQQ
jgi:hypothetical protein